nr:hypothetical protein [Heyndrickxia oleronia]
MESLIIAVIVGLISLFLNKKSNEGKQDKQDAPKPVSTPRSNRPLAKTITETISPPDKIQAKYREIKEAFEPTPEVDLKESFEKEMLPQKVNKESEPKQLEIDENDLLKGIILSEVLGPPRSKRPYRR